MKNRNDMKPLLLLYFALLLTAFGLLVSTTATAQSPVPDSFNPGANGWVQTMALQADKKILLGGRFTTVGGQTRDRIARVNVDGTLDPGFNPGADGTVESMVVQSDGTILVGGSFTILGGQTRDRIGRLDADGTLEPAFNPSANGLVRSLAVQEDGKIVVGGDFTMLGGQPRGRIGRLNPDGTLDPAFNAGADRGIYCLGLQPDGKILVGGVFATLNGQSRNLLGRLNADGTVDLGFNPIALGGWISSLAVQADGKILMGGGFWSVGGQRRTSLARLDPDGTVELAFDPVVFDEESEISALVVQADGNVLVGGEDFTLGGLRRRNLGLLNPDGTADVGFDPGASGWVACLAVPTDGKILVGGDFNILGGQARTNFGRLTQYGLAIEHLTRNGSTLTWLRGGTSPEVWRTSFESSTDGTNWTLLGAGTRIPGGWQLADASMQPDAIVRARGYVAGSGHGSGWFVESYTGHLELVSHPTSRTNNAGTTAQFQVNAGGLDPLSYQWFKEGLPLTGQADVTGATTSTLTLASVSKADEGAYQVVVSNLFGSVTSLVATLTVMDPFIVVPPVGTNRAVGDSVTLSVVAGGTPPLTYQWYRDGLPVPEATETELTMVNLSGADAGYYTVQVSNLYGNVISSPVPVRINSVTIDTSFEPVLDFVLALGLQADGKILMSGINNGLGRLNPDGTADPTFNPGPSSGVQCLAVQSDGKILVGGLFSALSGQPRTNLARVNRDGTLDLAFNPGVNGFVDSLAVQADEKILVAGYFTTLGGQAPTNLARLHPDGTLDASFCPIGSFFPPVTLQADGKILVGGWIAAPGEPTRIARLNPDGTLDPAFNPPEVTGLVWNADRDDLGSLAVQADGKILVAGNFSMLGGQSRLGIGRLNPDGTLDATFNLLPGAWAISGALALQADGKILGAFFIPGGPLPGSPVARLNPDGTPDLTFNPQYPFGGDKLVLQTDGKLLVGNYPPGGLGRLENAGPATQALAYDGSTLTWLRGGTGPEVWRTTFESSADGTNWTMLGAGTRIPGGWQLADMSLPPDAKVRARGYVTGTPNTSGWFVETMWNAPTPIQLSLHQDGDSVVLNWVGGRGPYQVQQSADLGQSSAWQDLGEAAHTNSITLPLGSSPLFLRVRGQ